MNQDSSPAPSSAPQTTPDGGCSMPDWVPSGCESDPHFASRILAGATPPPPARPPVRRRKLGLEDYLAGIRNRDVSILSRAITLVESNHPAHEVLAQDLLTRLLPETGRSIRVGITGVPGAGKSTLIEALGCLLCARGHRVAVLAVDPSSSISGGSILGDKTRMRQLVREPNAYIRPSPSAGSLGGVGRKSRETILLCEAAGYDVILVETVGVGQNEVTVRSMVDCFLLLMIAGAGDELQGMKKGVIEIADLLAVNKCDGENIARARLACTEYNRVLYFLQNATRGWKTRCTTCSALLPETLAELWENVSRFGETTRASGVFEERRRLQNIEWMHAMIGEELRNRFFRDERVRRQLPLLEQQVARRELPAAAAVRRIFDEPGPPTAP